MKKKLIIVFSALTLLVSTTFASNTTEPSQQIKIEFSRIFSPSTDVKWQVVSNFYVATFQQGEQYLTAYFNPSGNIEAVSRNILTTSLPLILQKGLQHKLQNAWVIESTELLGHNGTEYYVTLENANTKTTYNAPGGDWIVYKTIDK